MSLDNQKAVSLLTSISLFRMLERSSYSAFLHSGVPLGGCGIGKDQPPMAFLRASSSLGWQVPL